MLVPHCVCYQAWGVVGGGSALDSRRVRGDVAERAGLESVDAFHHLEHGVAQAEDHRQRRRFADPTHASDHHQRVGLDVQLHVTGEHELHPVLHDHADAPNQAVDSCALP